MEDAASADDLTPVMRPDDLFLQVHVLSLEPIFQPFDLGQRPADRLRLLGIVEGGLQMRGEDLEEL